jgi:hypothetical protein
MIIEDFTGKRFGKLVVIRGTIEMKYKRPNKYKEYECVCDCKKDKKINILTASLLKGTKSCGCLRVYNNLTDKIKPGEKYNKLLVVGFSDKEMKWEFLCECGETIFLPPKRVRRGNTKSCGCLNKEKNKQKMIIQINKRSNPNPIEMLAIRVYKARYSDGDLTFQQFFDLSQKDCFYCNAKPYNKRIKKPSQYSYLAELPIEKLTYRYNGLDRIDSGLPHNINNCVPSCGICNHMKSDLQQEKFIEHLIIMSKHNIIYSIEKYRKLVINDISPFIDKNKRSLFKSIRSSYKTRYKDDPNNSLSIEMFYQLSQLPCYYCGKEKSNLCNRAKTVQHASQHFIDTGDFYYNGLDRIDPKLPHTYNNCIPACNICNFGKGKLSFEVWMTWRDRIVEKYRDFDVVA